VKHILGRSSPGLLGRARYHGHELMPIAAFRADVIGFMTVLFLTHAPLRTATRMISSVWWMKHMHVE